jgi:hypothetical protein
MSEPAKSEADKGQNPRDFGNLQVFSKSGREGSSLLFLGKLIPLDISPKTDKYLIILYIHLWNGFCIVSR